jgi:general secretion pathway protein B
VIPAVVTPVVPSPAAAAPQKNAATDGDDDSPSSPRARRSTAPVIPQPVVRKQPVQNIPAPADIKLSGIAWQDERSGRRAVINGFLLKEGAVVSGAKIVDIQADRVRFSSPGGPFEIRLDAVLPAEVK